MRHKNRQLIGKGDDKMGIFGKSKKDDYNYDDGHNHNLFSDDDDFILPADSGGITSWEKRKNRIHAPHALTPDEVAHGHDVDNIPMTGAAVTQPDSVYKRMKAQENKTAESGIEDDYIPSWATAANNAASSAKMLENAASNNEADIKTAVPSKASVKHTAEPELSGTAGSAVGISEEMESTDAFLERCRMAVNIAVGKSPEDSSLHSEDSAASSENTAFYPASHETEPTAPGKLDTDDILRRLRGGDHHTEPSASDTETDGFSQTPSDSYSKINTPTSVEKIKIYGHGSDSTASEKDSPVAAGLQAESTISNADDDTRRKIDVEVEIIPTDSPSDIMHTTRVSHAHNGDVRIYGKVVRGAVIQHTPDGDVDISETINAKKAACTENEKTIMFGELENAIFRKAESDFDSLGQDDNINEEYDEEEYDELPYYESDDKSLDGIDDYKSLSDAARLRVELMGQKSKHTVYAVFSAIATLLIIAVTSPLGAALSEKAVAIINLVLFAATLLINHNIFADFINLFKGKPCFDSCVSVASSVTLVQCAVCTFVYNGKYAESAAAATLLLAVNSIAKVLKTSRILKGIEKIATSENKRAVISADRDAGNTMASGAVEGEALVLCGKSTINITDYLKSSNYASPLDLKTKALFFTGIAAALITGIAAGYISGACLGLTLAALILCCLFPACAVLTCELPMYLAVSRIARYGAMLAGYKGAYNLNLANTVSVNTSDLFPEGTVKLYNMKPLGNNEIGESLIDAAAVAIKANSPLAGIFRDIIGDAAEKDIPKVNGVQYEDKMGISGWIGEKTILIGNRNLMQGHNIEVPPVTVDKKILRAGYFPVYIACDGVPCLLFVVRYDVDPNIASELQRLCNTGMTVVVNPEDPNATDLMLCNYFGLPNDAIKVMNHNARTVYEKTVRHEESVSASAGFTRSICGFFSAVTSSIKLRGTYAALTALYIIAAVLGAVLLIYMSVTGKLGIVNSVTFSAYQLLFVLMSVVIAKVKYK